MNELFFDLETIPLPPEKREAWKPNIDMFAYGILKDDEKYIKKYDDAFEVWKIGRNAALSAMTGRVALIGTIGEKVYEVLHEYNLLSETRMLEIFYSLIARPSYQLIGFNILDFDLPFLVRRSWVHGLKPPTWLLQDMAKYRPDNIIDLRRVWGMTERQPKGKLTDLVYALLGETFPEIKTKSGLLVEGANFWRCWQDDREACIRYNRTQLEYTKRLYERMC